MKRVIRSLLAAGVAAVALAAVGPALATEASGQQNPDLAVTSSLRSSGEDPDVATTGDTVTAAGFVRNESDKAQTVTVRVELVYPDGTALSKSRKVRLASGETVNESLSYVVGAEDPQGTYTYTVSATGRNGTSTASSTIEVR